MSRRSNVELAGVNTASDVRQELVREIALLESFEQDSKNIQLRRNKILNSQKQQQRTSSAGADVRNDNYKQNDNDDEAPPSVSSPSPSRVYRAGLCIEGAIADTELSTAQREIAREEAALRFISKTEKQKQRLKDHIQLFNDRVSWAAEFIAKQERQERETLEFLSASKFVETEQRERARRQREKVDEEVEEYLKQRQLVDDLHSAMVEDRWLTRDQVLKEAADIREAREMVEREWRQEREHVFLDESDVFTSP